MLKNGLENNLRKTTQVKLQYSIYCNALCVCLFEYVQFSTERLNMRIRIAVYQHN